VKQAETVDKINELEGKVNGLQKENEHLRQMPAELAGRMEHMMAMR